MTEYFDMSLTFDDIELMKRVVNQGIDSRLEGFTKSEFEYKPDESILPFVVIRLECKIHPDEMSILLRRLEELGDSEEWDENAYLLANDIIQVYYDKEII